MTFWTNAKPVGETTVRTLVDEVLFNKYLNFLHTVLPPTAEFTEKAWKW
ncbi:Uncharacterized protein AC496_4365 [Pseudomonas savastanoi pv. glycinea]|uniref:Uncharacterized protein n=1 Tax=Pseudomonas savastanoi pv. glycinea TaxID=318 RepID=A0A3M4PVB4_PSESG|nr:Uncharacterized protein AC498_0856 [Pseudomonas savastanoi pv. glycinea]KPC27601.1 Uncharacterized protein AC497_0881 [Pseudomonas savastanoi pv. glycinea]KPC42798.1 Uncharacterized protein AC496_4365 [Pseudomonas savastanoi pv. glycinea]KPC51936.1 Uncharacterized protein ABK00_1891 [Pseudomonas savastanoi pv. glycinea]RML32344.1 Permease [Pseudomonas savastanoi pv. glycinea]